MRNGNVDTDGDRGGVGRGEEIDGYVEWPKARVICEALGGLTLNIVFGAYEVGKGGEELENGKDCVSDVVVERGLETFGEAARKQMIPMGVNRFGTERAWWGSRGVEKGESEFAAEEEAVCVGGETVILETTGKRVEGDAGGGREERRQDVEDGVWELLTMKEKGLGGEKVVETAL